MADDPLPTLDHIKSRLLVAVTVDATHIHDMLSGIVVAIEELRTNVDTRLTRLERRVLPREERSPGYERADGGSAEPSSPRAGEDMVSRLDRLETLMTDAASPSPRGARRRGGYESDSGPGQSYGPRGDFASREPFRLVDDAGVLRTSTRDVDDGEDGPPDGDDRYERRRPGSPGMSRRRPDDFDAPDGGPSGGSRRHMYDDRYDDGDRRLGNTNRRSSGPADGSRRYDDRYDSDHYERRRPGSPGMSRRRPDDFDAPDGGPTGGSRRHTFDDRHDDDDRRLGNTNRRSSGPDGSRRYTYDDADDRRRPSSPGMSRRRDNSGPADGSRRYSDRYDSDNYERRRPG
eukprot:PhM_4_TR3110/c1_g1_i4/m.35154